jgi:hypothetical protein
VVEDADAARERALDELYGSEPDDFVATRKRLAAELRRAGHRDAAAVVAKARRPTKAAATLNAAARTEPDAVARYLDASAAVRDAQSGAGADVRGAIRAQREALDELAATALGADASEARRSEVMTALQAAAIDEHVAALLRAGRLVRAEEAEVDFTELLAGAPGLPAPPPRPRKERPQTSRPAPEPVPAPVETAPVETAPDATAAVDAGEERAEAERAAKARAAREAAAAAESAAEAAAREADERAATVTRLEDELRAARDAARTARRAATAARRAADTATARARKWDAED